VSFISSALFAPPSTRRSPELQLIDQRARLASSSSAPLSRIGRAGAGLPITELPPPEQSTHEKSLFLLARASWISSEMAVQFLLGFLHFQESMRLLVVKLPYGIATDE